MWLVYEGPEARKNLRRLPLEALKRYEKWKDIVRYSGPKGLRLIKEFHDEALGGEWKCFRSGRLTLRYRVIYEAQKQDVLVNVIRITPHDYRR